LKDRFLKHWKPILIVSIVLVGIIPLLIHIAFVFIAPCGFFAARWDAGNVLEFYGALIGAGGTIVLGYVAYWQTKRANEQADKANQISESLIALEQSKLIPRFYLQWSGSGGSQGIKFLLKNYSDYVALDIELDALEISSSDTKLKPIIAQFTTSRFTGCMRGGEEVEIEFNGTNAVTAFNNCDTFSLKISYSDLLDARRTTLITGKQKAQYKYSYTYKTEEVPAHE